MRSTVTESLGYDQSPNFFRPPELEERPFTGFHHVYRRARESCGLRGVYLLDDKGRRSRGEMPVVFYCKARNEDEAIKIHRRIWNQGVVPFILVETPTTLRLYSGFRFSADAKNDPDRGVLMAAIAFNEVADRLADFRAESIDSGSIWERWEEAADPRHRVDWSLLAELEKLGAELRNLGLEREPGHTLIGKLVYLKYLRDRRILSDRKLHRWGLEAADVFGPRASLEAFRELNEHLDRWLNGSVFPLQMDSIRKEHLRLVTSVFEGGTTEGQLALDLGIYDFSFIPIETLSVIYEQFLHAEEDGEMSRGRRSSAYYTPIPLVNYMLGELEARRPLEEGMRVLDPSCGSGAFLVQCYRLLIEKRRREKELTAVELRQLLSRHIFGVDRDPEACRVAEMSLILTLLDYVSPPDLESKPQFKLPALAGTNVFHADFFDPGSEWADKRSHLEVDWLVGNPPWREAKRSVEEDQPALRWMKRHADEFPTGGHQVAEAFVWHSIPMLRPDAVAALLLPAMTLFKMESTDFRARLFTTVNAWALTNFANLAYVLFAGRSKTPALALFFEPWRESTGDEDERILSAAPFLFDQPAIRAQKSRRSREPWSLVISGGERRELRHLDVADGDFRPWKGAMWGSPRDAQLLLRISRRHPTLEEFASAHDLTGPYEGFQLRKRGGESETEPMPELTGKPRVDFSKLKNCGRIFEFPSKALTPIERDKANLRKRGGTVGLEVSKPPHIVIDASRRFAIYSERFIAVPARKPAISGPDETRALLKALALYLGSNFCRYQQFFTTPEWGIRTSIATLSSLRSLPVPLAGMDDEEITVWASLQDKLAAETPAGETPPEESLKEADNLVYESLGLDVSEKVLIEDFLRWNMRLVQGKVPRDLVAPPDDESILEYLVTLQKELDVFIGEGSNFGHDVSAVRGDGSAMIVIRMASERGRPPRLIAAEKETVTRLQQVRERLLQRHSQWLYFERNLRIYEEGAMYVFKPLETVHWTRRQAILDAGEVIAETLGSQSA